MKSPRTKIINGDCCTELKRVPDGSIDLVVTDPPYLVSYRSRDGRKLAGDRRDSGWLQPAFTEVSRVLKDNRYCVCFYGWSQAEKFLIAWKSAGLYPVGHFVFQKSYASAQRFTRSLHECAYLLAKGRPERPQVLLNSVLPWSYTGNKLHPTEKPICAIEPLIAAFSEPGEVVLDPFCGSGTVGRAALRLNRSFLGIEIDPEYHRIAVEHQEA